MHRSKLISETTPGIAELSKEVMIRKGRQEKFNLFRVMVLKSGIGLLRKLGATQFKKKERLQMFHKRRENVTLFRVALMPPTINRILLIIG